MSVFDKQTAEELFEDLWKKMIKDAGVGKKFKEFGISILFEINDPEIYMYVDEEGPLFGDEAKSKNPVVIMKMSGDSVHQFWLNKLNIAKALAFRKIKAKGPVNKVLQILPLLKPGQEFYPEYCKKYNLPME